jgi:serine protease Do
VLLNVPQAGGYLVKTVVRDSLAERLGLTGGDRTATIDGLQLALGGDIILAAQGIDILTIDDLIAATRAIRDQPAGREVRMRVLRGGRVVELTTTGGDGTPTTPPR